MIHEDLPRFDNSGYVVDVGGTRVYHPGDSFTPPGGPVDVLLLPIHAPWSKISEVVDFGRRSDAPRSVAVHDGLLNDTGLPSSAGTWPRCWRPTTSGFEPGRDRGS